MKTRAAVAFAAKKPLEIVELDLDGPKAGEVLVEIKATGICHTDAYTLDGFDSEGIFPSILGHEGAGIVREVGAGGPSLCLDRSLKCRVALAQVMPLAREREVIDHRGRQPERASDAASLGSHLAAMGADRLPSVCAQFLGVLG